MKKLNIANIKIIFSSDDMYYELTTTPGGGT
jgi:hypothetical protein